MKKLLLGCLLLTGCGDGPLQQQKPDPVTEAARLDALRHPIGRFVIAGKREYSNGTEVYVLDTKSGQVCYYFVASGRGDNEALKADMRACAGEPLDPLL